MTRLLPVYLLASLLVACSGAGPEVTAETSHASHYGEDLRPRGQTFVYECDDGFEFIARLGAGEMAVWLEDRYEVLPQVPSASGAKYVEQDLTFWTKGAEALFVAGKQSHANCRNNPERVPWEDARRRGVDFRAIGNEPGWYLEIQHERHLLFVGSYGMKRVMLNLPTVEQLGQARIYSASGGESDLRVEVRDVACVDSMKGDSFPSSVVVQLGPERLYGCGRRLLSDWQ